jgi:hypothetical protein
MHQQNLTHASRSDRQLACVQARKEADELEARAQMEAALTSPAAGGAM